MFFGKNSHLKSSDNRNFVDYRIVLKKNNNKDWSRVKKNQVKSELLNSAKKVSSSATAARLNYIHILIFSTLLLDNYMKKVRNSQYFWIKNCILALKIVEIFGSDGSFVLFFSKMGFILYLILVFISIGNPPTY